MFDTTVMTTGTFNFAPSVAEVIVSAFSRIQVKRTEILASHMQDAIAEFNYLLAKMDNLQPNLWTVDLQTVPLVQGNATYSVPAETIMMLDVFIRYGSPATDRILFPISRTEYASLVNKTAQGFPSQFWFDRLRSPTLTLYLTPDGNGPYVLYYYRVRQIQDAITTNGLQPEVPTRWLDALVSGLSHRLSRIYAPQLEMIRKADADEAWKIAAEEDQENVPIQIQPGLGGYWR